MRRDVFFHGTILFAAEILVEGGPVKVLVQWGWIVRL